MFKTIKSILTTVTVSAILCINLLNINVQAVKSDSINLPITSNNTYEKKKVKIINGEIDLYPDIILNKKDQERFDNCKKEINLKRANRFKNKPTPCLKMSDT